MHNSRFHAMVARLSRPSSRRSSSVSSQASTDRNSILSRASSPVSTINSIVFRHKFMEPAEEELKELNILEPRPVAHFCSLEERMASF
ncbi:hypothetical protein B0T26DRAFT_14295 [Lasiosphaeria miniovina]|uniref:Uncharacterized protein n=1 Tax=Lasiosphaeria miniovina TaxID=1954250 RepID=A0AA40BFN0_9PEZI|nr:uncharacterized protein B0T26DRAFT_14295 [Lasiosphaeria miniovina]KAK0733365.1 hypothetical protein B0T26DRAFT_14295 [Lasiosphaeria miniovina]